jgi:hypothetical protein
MMVYALLIISIRAVVLKKGKPTEPKTALSQVKITDNTPQLLTYPKESTHLLKVRLCPSL